MDTIKLASRRSILKGLGTLAAFAGVGGPATAAEAAAKPVFVRVGSPSPLPGAVSAAIARHRRARRTVNRLGAEWDRLYSLPGRPEPKVRYGWLLTMRRDDKGEPLFAYSHSEIDREVDRDVEVRRTWGRTDFSSAEQRRARMHRELTTLIRRQRAFDRKSGLRAIGLELDAADRHEAECAAAVLLAMPVTANEATTKAAYLKRHAGQWLGYEGTTAAMSIVLQTLCATGRAV